MVLHVLVDEVQRQRIGGTDNNTSVHIERIDYNLNNAHATGNKMRAWVVASMWLYGGE